MHNLSHIIIRILRKVYFRFFNHDANNPVKRDCIKDSDLASQKILNLLNTNKPCLIARFGANELNVCSNYIGITKFKHNPLAVIMGKQPQWWWNEGAIDNLVQCAGFFPKKIKLISSFSELIIQDSSEIDILGGWLDNEKYLDGVLKPNLVKISLPYLEPFHSSKPWSSYLKDKRIVVIHPFEESILSQYKRREKLFNNTEVLPQFKSLRIIKAVQSIGGKAEGFDTWFDALDYMKSELDKEEYDIVLTGCGAYGLHLAAHAKRTGHQAIHLGGALQLLFGIKGKRWEDENQCAYWNMPKDSYTKLFNNYWIKPLRSEQPKTANQVENGCYW